MRNPAVEIGAKKISNKNKHAGQFSLNYYNGLGSLDQRNLVVGNIFSGISANLTSGLGQPPAMLGNMMLCNLATNGRGIT